MSSLAPMELQELKKAKSILENLGFSIKVVSGRALHRQETGKEIRAGRYKALVQKPVGGYC